jgi:hypothetical protein
MTDIDAIIANLSEAQKDALRRWTEYWVSDEVAAELKAKWLVTLQTDRIRFLTTKGIAVRDRLLGDGV